MQENPLNISHDEYDERVRRNYAERQQAETDARYEDFDIADAVKIADDVYSGVTKREKLLSQASNQKLKNAINELYRPGAVTGDGGTADAIRSELKTGAPVGGKPHIQKGYDRLRNLQNILKREELTPREKTIIQELIDDLEKALRGE